MQLTKKEIIILGLGSNLGEREEHLRNAIRELTKQLQVEITISQVYQSEPWGFEADTLFLNCCVSFESSIDPMKLLAITQGIERKLGRKSKRKEGTYFSRVIDIDILYIGEEVIKTSKLTIPHPLIKQRGFVLAPLKDLITDSIGFLTEEEITRLLRDINGHEAVKLYLSALF